MGADRPVPSEAQLRHNHEVGTICGESCPRLRHGNGVSMNAGDGDNSGESTWVDTTAMEAWKARGRELNAVYSAIAEAVRTAGIEPTPDEPMTDLVALAAMCERRGELVEQLAESLERATTMAERYGQAVIAIHKTIAGRTPRPRHTINAIRLILAGLDS